MTPLVDVLCSSLTRSQEAKENLVFRLVWKMENFVATKLFSSKILIMPFIGSDFVQRCCFFNCS